jgi:hypothetical protein
MNAAASRLVNRLSSAVRMTFNFVTGMDIELRNRTRKL